MPSDRKAIWGDEPKPLMPYSPAIKAGGWVFFAGQLASDFKTGLAPEAGGDGRNPNVDNQLELQSRFVMQNLKKTADAAGIDIGQGPRPDLSVVHISLSHDGRNSPRETPGPASRSRLTSIPATSSSSSHVRRLREWGSGRRVCW